MHRTSILKRQGSNIIKLISELDDLCEFMQLVIVGSGLTRSSDAKVRVLFIKGQKVPQNLQYWNVRSTIQIFLLKRRKKARWEEEKKEVREEGEKEGQTD